MRECKGKERQARRTRRRGELSFVVQLEPMTSEKEGYLIVTTVSFRDPVMMRGRRAHFLAPLSGLRLVLLNREGPVLQGMLQGAGKVLSSREIQALPGPPSRVNTGPQPPGSAAKKHQEWKLHNGCPLSGAQPLFCVLLRLAAAPSDLDLPNLHQ